ncbi:hypothetical protein NOVO_01995 [Rickettsiales bacterium Ac37b]|nr:hypothetical protein NOVO_01995 [Rickettsiales bacterium Ac37b]
MVPKQILTASKDTEYAAGEITDAETSYSSSDSPNSSPEDSSNLKHTNIKEKLAKNGIVVEDIDTSELPPNREKYTKMLQEKINKNDRER